MKKIIYLSSIICTFILVISCSDEKAEVNYAKVDMYNKSYIENATQVEKEAYAKFHLLKIASYLDDNYSNSKLNQDIASKALNDGSSKTIYVKELIYNFKNKINTNEKNSSFEIFRKSLDAFEDLENRNWQVTITKPITINALNKDLDESKPIFILSVDTEKGINATEVDGYQKNEQEIMEKLDEKVDEQIAIDNVVYKLGIAVMPDGYGDDEGGGGGSGSSSTNDGNIGGINGTGAGIVVTPGSSGGYNISSSGLTIKYIRALIKKESWIEENETHFNGFYEPLIVETFAGGNQQEDNTLDGTEINGDFLDNQIWRGKEIAKFSSSEVNQGETKFANFLINAPNFNLISSSIYFVIFEHDNWPAPLNDRTFIFTNGNVRKIYYRSWEPVYDQQILFWEPAGQYFSNPTAYPIAQDFSVNNGQIIYDLFVKP